MDLVDKIFSISSNIFKIYQELIDLEKINFNTKKIYQDKLEILKLYKQLEDENYKKLFEQSDLKRLIKLKCRLNLDNMLEIQLTDLDFITQDQILNQEGIDNIVKRRIFNTISNKIVELSNSDDVIDQLRDEAFSLCDSCVDIGDKIILTAGRGNTVYSIFEKAMDNILLKYIYFIQLYIVTGNINQLGFLIQKYDLLFLNKNLENKMFEESFQINLDFIDRVKNQEDFKANQELYYFFLKEKSIEIFLDAVYQTLEMQDQDFESKTAIINLFQLEKLESIIRACALEVDEQIKDEQIYEIQNIKNSGNEKIRKKLVKTIEYTKKDRIQLSYH